MLGPAAVKVGHELNPYTPDWPFYSATDVQPCPLNHKWGQTLNGAAAKGLRQVGPGHKAYYRAWKGTCVTGTGKARAAFVPAGVVSAQEWRARRRLMEHPRTDRRTQARGLAMSVPGVLKRAAWR